MPLAYIGLGSNEGERELMISRAVQLLREQPSIHVTQLSFLKEYEPVGGPPQDRYVNAVAAIETSLSPVDLLAALQRVERALGRRPSTVRWGPRPIDLDVLLYGDAVIHEPHLTVPHPRMHARRFVLEPFAHLAPEALHPMLHQTIRQMLATLESSSAARVNSDSPEKTLSGE